MVSRSKSGFAAMTSASPSGAAMLYSSATEAGQPSVGGASGRTLEEKSGWCGALVVTSRVT